jgi:hypothetical protein
LKMHQYLWCSIPSLCKTTIRNSSNHG